MNTTITRVAAVLHRAEAVRNLRALIEFSRAHLRKPCTTILVQIINRLQPVDELMQGAGPAEFRTLDAMRRYVEFCYPNFVPASPEEALRIVDKIHIPRRALIQLHRWQRHLESPKWQRQRRLPC